MMHPVADVSRSIGLSMTKRQLILNVLTIIDECREWL